MSDSSFSAVMTSLGFTFIEFPIETSYPVPASSSSHLSVIGNLSSVSYVPRKQSKKCIFTRRQLLHGLSCHKTQQGQSLLCKTASLAPPTAAWREPQTHLPVSPAKQSLEKSWLPPQCNVLRKNDEVLPSLPPEHKI